MTQQIVPPSSHAPTEVVGRLVNSLSELSPQLRRAARYVLENPREVGVSSITELAQAAGVKPNTLVRMARAVGYDGYDGFRAPFREQLKAHGRDFPDRARWLQSVARSGRHGELFTEMASGALSNVEALYGGITAREVKVVADLIVEARTTYILGVGIAHATARNFAYLANMALETVVAIPRDGSLPVDNLARASRGDVLLAITFDPYRTEVVHAVRCAREQGVSIVAVTDTLTSPIVPGATHVFRVPTQTAQFFTSTVALGALLETLMAFVIADAPDAVVASIHRFHQHRHEAGIYWNEDA